MRIFVVCFFSGQGNRCARGRKNGNAELKSRAVNEIKNVLAEVAKVAEVLPFLPFLPVQMFIKSGKSDLPGKAERDGVGQMHGKRRKAKRLFLLFMQGFPAYAGLVRRCRMHQAHRQIYYGVRQYQRESYMSALS